MREVLFTVGVIRSARTVGGGTGSGAPDKTVVTVRVPAAHRRRVLTLPLHNVAAGRAGTASACGV